MTKVSRGIVRILAVALGPLVGLTIVMGVMGPAHAAQEGDALVAKAAAAFQNHQAVYVDPGASGAVSEDTVAEVKSKVGAASRPIYVAVLPGAARDEVANPRDLPAAIRAANAN